MPMRSSFDCIQMSVSHTYRSGSSLTAVAGVACVLGKVRRGGYKCFLEIYYYSIIVRERCRVKQGLAQRNRSQ